MSPSPKFTTAAYNLCKEQAQKACSTGGCLMIFENVIEEFHNDTRIGLSGFGKEQEHLLHPSRVKSKCIESLLGVLPPTNVNPVRGKRGFAYIADSMNHVSVRGAALFYYVLLFVIIFLYFL